MFWNHRVLLHKTNDPEDSFLAIHEVHYDDDGTPEACTQEPAEIVGDTLTDLNETLARMQQCLNRSILDYDSFGTKEGAVSAEKTAIFLP